MKNRKVKLRFKLLILAVFLVYAGIAIFGQQTKIDELKAKQEALTIEAEQAQTELNRLEHKKAYMNTNEYIENTARERFGLVYENELILQEDDETQE
jgi:cell division protein DivIC